MNARVLALCVSCLFLVGAAGVPAPAAAAPPSGGPRAVLVDDGSAAVASIRLVRMTTPQRQEAAPPATRPVRPWWGWVLLGRMHAIVVHFPIALLTVAAVIEALHLLRRRPVPSEAATYCLVFGLAGALVSVWFGTLNASHQTLTGDAAVAVERHRVMGWIAMAAAAATLGVGQLARRARQVRTVAAYVALAVATSAVVGATGHLGGGLVYGEAYLTGVLPWNQAAPASVAASATLAAGRPAADPVATPDVIVARPEPPVVSTNGSATSALPGRHAATAATAAVDGAAPAVVTRSRDAGLAAPSTSPTGFEAMQAPGVDFARDVKPIFDKTCVECHGPDKVKARLRMDSVEALQKGGKSGALLKPGDPDNSLIMRRVLGLDGEDQMPLDKDPLTEAQIDTLRRWIAAGAPYGAAGSQ